LVADSASPLGMRTFPARYGNARKPAVLDEIEFLPNLQLSGDLMDRFHSERDRLPTPRSRTHSRRRRRPCLQPRLEAVEARVVLSHGAGSALHSLGILTLAPAYQAVRPNTPVAPFGSTLATATFLDPSAHFLNGNHIFVGQKTLVGPYATLDARSGFIKIGTGSAVLDNATIIATPSPSKSQPTTNVLIGDSVSIGYGATIFGPSTIGAYGLLAKATAVGPNAVIDGATISAGAIVGALARVGPGVVVPSGMYVLPGANVTTNAQASNPALGMVEAIPSSISASLTKALTRSTALALGYTTLFQGDPAAGASPGVLGSVTGVNNGNLANVLGSSPEPGPATSAAATGINFEKSKTGPKYPGPFMPAVEGDISSFPARITGDARFNVRAAVVASHLGRSNSIRADQGQPITFNGVPTTGNHVTITSPNGGTVTSGTTTTTTGAMTFGQHFVADQGAVILGGSGLALYTFGDNVTVGSGAVVSESSLGSNVSIGAKSYISGSTIAADTVIPPGTVMINNVVVGRVQW
jgi:carbonic anhydrase/acetyltransferase-like protein (isoleucine patch superfamily)